VSTVLALRNCAREIDYLQPDQTLFDCTGLHSLIYLISTVNVRAHQSDKQLY
jgi:hypothetical protein